MEICPACMQKHTTNDIKNDMHMQLPAVQAGSKLCLLITNLAFAEVWHANNDKIFTYTIW